MPTISTYGEPRVGIQVAKGPQASELPSAAFETVGKGLANVAQEAVNIKQRADQAHAEDVMLNFEKAKNTLLYDPKNGYYTTQGKNAYDQAASTNEALNKLMQQHADQIGDPTARDAFVKTATVHVMDAEHGIMQHSMSGLNTWETQNTKAQVEGALQNAPLYRNNPKQISIQRILGETAVREAAAREGVTDGDVLKQRLIDFNSNFSVAAISASIHDGSEAGIKAMNEYGDHLTEPDRVKMEKALENKQKKETTAYISSTGIAAGRSIADQYYDQGLDAARKQVDAKYSDPKLNEAVTKEVIAEFRRKDYQKTRDATNATNAAEEFLQGATVDQPRTINDFKTQQPDIWAQIPDSSKRTLESGKYTVTNQDTLLRIKSMSMPELATLNMGGYIDQLSATDRKDVMKMIQDARSGKHDVQLQSDSQYIAAKVKEYGLNDDQKQQAITAAQDELNRTVEQTGKPLSDRDRQKVLRDSLSAFTVQHGWYRPDTVLSPDNTPIPTLHALNVVSDQIINALPNIDTNELHAQLADVVTDMDNAGTPVTIGSLLQAYLIKYPKRKNQNPPQVSSGIIKR